MINAIEKMRRYLIYGIAGVTFVTLAYSILELFLLLFAEGLMPLAAVFNFVVIFGMLLVAGYLIDRLSLEIKKR